MPHTKAYFEKHGWDREKIRVWIEDEGRTHKWVAEQMGAGTNPIVSRFCLLNGIKTQRTGPRAAEGHPNWKGGRTTDKDGYVLIYMPDHPRARRLGRREPRYVLEHILVMEEKLGRPLRPGEVVHHINSVRDDNRPENLQSFLSNADHLRHELTGKVSPKWTPELRSYMSRVKSQWWHNQKKSELGGSS